MIEHMAHGHPESENAHRHLHVQFDYGRAFAIGIAVSVLSAIAIWQASPGKVRAVAGRMPKVPGGNS